LGYDDVPVCTVLQQSDVTFGKDDTMCLCAHNYGVKITRVKSFYSQNRKGVKEIAVTIITVVVEQNNNNNNNNNN